MTLVPVPASEIAAELGALTAAERGHAEHHRPAQGVCRRRVERALAEHLPHRELLAGILGESHFIKSVEDLHGHW